MDTVDRLQQATAFINNGNYTVTLALATYPHDAEAPICRSLNISDEVASGFQSFAIEQVVKLERLRADGDLQLLEYSAGFKPDDHHVEYIDLTDDQLGATLHGIPSPAQIPLLGDVKNFVDDVRFYFISLSGGNRRAVLFRRYSRNKELLRSKNLVMRLLGERYERIVEPTFQFDPAFDALMFRDRLFILNKSNFQHIFRYFELLRAVAEESLAAISAVVPIANFNAFRDSCTGHLQKLEKLRNISRKPYLKHVTMARIKATIRNFELAVKVERIDGKEQLVFDPTDRWAILNLLDDAYLGSEMTGFKYEANSKRQI